MISDDERRHIAAELKRMADDNEGSLGMRRLMEVGDAAKQLMGVSSLPDCASVMRRYADLIDRPTCINESDEDGHFTCSKCRCSVEVAKIVCNDFGEEFPLPLTPSYCPNCGRQVVRDE